MGKRRTKIVCTLGPSVGSPEKIKELIDSGMNVARLNCSHGSWESKSEWVKAIRFYSSPTNPIAILADLQGPKFRIDQVKGDSIEVETKQYLNLANVEGEDLYICDTAIWNEIEIGDRLILGDGFPELKVISSEKNIFKLEVLNPGNIRNKIGITIIGKSIDAPALSSKDLEDLENAILHDVEIVALSYVRKKEDIISLKKILEKRAPHIQICAKIETQEAIKDIDGILEVADIVMVARGDLGLQLDIEDVPIIQKEIISKANQVGKPVITATQMLESMMFSARPTRAEVSDIANAILDGTDAVMLSGETASGKFPIHAVQAMARISEKSENMLDCRHQIHRIKRHFSTSLLTTTEAVAMSSVEIATDIGAKAIITTTTSGQTPRMISRFRPKIPVYCASWSLATQRQLSISWGVEAIYMPIPANMDDVIVQTIEGFIKLGKLQKGDTVVVTSGAPVGVPGHTNLIAVHVV